jgi:hypothetical protein
MRVAIYYNSKELAGAEYLFITVSKKFIKEGHCVFIYDNEKKIIASNVEGSVPLRFGDSIRFVDLLILSMSDVLNWEENVKIGVVKKILIWNMHPDNVYGLMRLGARCQKIFKSLRVAVILIKLINWRVIGVIRRKLTLPNTSVVFIDGQNKSKFRELIRLNFHDDYFPIPYSIDRDKCEIIDFREKNIERELNLLVLGRLVDFKVIPLLSFLKKFNHNEIILNVTIVGDGELRSIIEKEWLLPNVKIKIVGYKYGSELLNYINTNDVAFAMGTAALDLAVRGMPVLLSPIGDDSPGKCCWIHQAFDFNTAYTLESPSLDWDDILYDLRHKRREIILEGRRYVFKNHSIDKIFGKIARLIY